MSLLREIGYASAAILKTLVGPMLGKDELIDSVGYVVSNGPPTSVVPDFIGQHLYDSSTPTWYKAHGVAAGQWTLSGVPSNVVLAQTDPVTGGIRLAVATQPGSTGIVQLSDNFYGKPKGLINAFGSMPTGGGPLSANTSHRTVTTVPAGFCAVRCILFNADTSNIQLNTKVHIASSESFANTSKPTVSGSVDYSVGGTFLFSGVSTVNCPVAPSAKVPSVTVSDWLACRSLDRTDVVGAPPLVYVTRYNATADAGIGYATYSANTINYLNTITGNNHVLHHYQQAGDCVTTPTNFTSTSEATFNAPVGIEFRFNVPVFTVAVFGDSTCAGAYYTGPSVESVPQFTQAAAYVNNTTTGTIVDTFVMAESGLTSAQYYARLLSITAVTTPCAIFYQPISTNDGTYTTSTVARLAVCSSLIDYCDESRVTLILETPKPDQVSGTVTSDARKTAYNVLRNAILSMASSKVFVIDNDWMHDSFNKGAFAADYGYDASHLNYSGNTIYIDSIADVLQKMIS